jgi:hypothetical protein
MRRQAAGILDALVGQFLDVPRNFAADAVIQFPLRYATVDVDRARNRSGDLLQ